MIHFCALDFNMCRSEEVISFYFDAQCIYRSHSPESRDATFQEISWNQEISDRKKELQEKWNSVSR